MLHRLLAVFVLVSCLLVPCRSDANVIGWVASYLLGKGVDALWDAATGKPDVRELQGRLRTLEAALADRDRKMADEIRALRANVSSNTTKSQFESMVRDTLDRLAVLERRVDKNSSDIATNRNELKLLSDRVLELEKARVATNQSAPSQTQQSATTKQNAPSSISSSSNGKTPKQAQAREIYASALHLFWARDYKQAAGDFATAQFLDETDPRYSYFLALCLRNLGHDKSADAVLAEAVAKEQSRPMTDWGMAMQRVQGDPRQWLEAARRNL